MLTVAKKKKKNAVPFFLSQNPLVLNVILK